MRHSHRHNAVFRGVVVFAAVFAVGCAKPASRSVEKADTAAPTAESAPVKSAPSAAADATTVINLSSRGLPLMLTAPSCVKVLAPVVKVAENAKDVMLSCPISDDDSIAGNSAFAIQVGLAKGKNGKADIAKDPNFVRFLPSTDSKLLQWESSVFNSKVKDFMLRVTKGSVEYVCFNQLSSRDEAVFAQMLKACQSLESAK